MNSQQEKALFEEWGWEYDHIARRWNNHNGTVWITLDFIVHLTKEPDGDLLLMKTIVQCGRPSKEDADATPSPSPDP